MLLALVLLPALVLGPALDGATLWFHAHGRSHDHVHLLPDEHVHAHPAALHAWHAARHGRGDEQGLRPDGQSAPRGLAIRLPQVVATAPAGTTPAAAARAQAPVLSPAPRWHLAPVASTHRPELCRSGWPPLRAERSGVAALLRSSHALLI